MRHARTEAGSGPVVLLVPGFTGSKEDFHLVLPLLAAQGLRAVAIDQRGQFESPGCEDRTAYAVDRLGADLLDLIDDLGGPVHLVGHSFGGLVARAAVLQRPSAMRSLTLLSSGPAALTGPRVALLPLLRPLLEQGGIVALADALDALTAQLPQELQRPQQEADFLRRRFVRNCPTGLLAMAEALVSEPDRTSELAAAGVPTLVAFGERDDAWSPRLQAEMADRLGARCVELAGAAHSPAVEAPDALVAALVEHVRHAEEVWTTSKAQIVDPDAAGA